MNRRDFLKYLCTSASVAAAVPGLVVPGTTFKLPEQFVDADTVISIYSPDKRIVAAKALPGTRWKPTGDLLRPWILDLQEPAEWASHHFAQDEVAAGIIFSSTHPVYGRIEHVKEITFTPLGGNSVEIGGRLTAEVPQS